jgi:hypothetical protein
MTRKSILFQRLRSSPQPVQGWERYGLAFETEEALEFVDAEALCVAFLLQDTKRDQTAHEMMLLRLFRVGLTACQSQLILAHADDFLDLRADTIHPAHLCSRTREAIGGIVLLAVSDEVGARNGRT